MRLDPVTGLIDEARYVPSPNFNERPLQVAIETLVIHAISLPPQCYGDDYIERLFTNRLEPHVHPYFETISELKVSAHFLITRDGSLVQFVPTTKRAWHAGVSRFGERENVNDFSLGVELEGCDADIFEDAQYTCLTMLTRCLCAVYTDIHSNSIVGHSDIAPGRKTDPGPGFDWQRYRQSIS